MFRRRFGLFPRLFWVRNLSRQTYSADTHSSVSVSQPQSGTAVDRRKRRSKVASHVRGATVDLCTVQKRCKASCSSSLLNHLR